MDLAILKLQKQLQTAKCKELKKPPNWRFFYVSILMSGTLCLVFSALYIEQGNQFKRSAFLFRSKAKRQRFFEWQRLTDKVPLGISYTHLGQ